jgi:magnesium-transporting ATPase (P-type)
VNGAGTFVLRAERVGSETLLAQIVRQVGEAQRSRAPIQRLADRVSAWFVPAVVVVAIVTFAVWALAGPAPRLVYAIVNAVAVLIVACPCALGLATPMSIAVAMGRGAHAGVLVRDAAALETLAKVDTLLFDKTGTLTEGKPRLTDVEAYDGCDQGSAPAAGCWHRAWQRASARGGHRTRRGGARRHARQRLGIHGESWWRRHGGRRRPTRHGRDARTLARSGHRGHGARDACRGVAARWACRDLRGH